MVENQNISETILSEINSSIFFKEFTFDKTEFYPEDGQKELADNLVSLDELLFVYQVKERNSKTAKGKADNWFQNKVLKKAKNQIKDTVNYLQLYDQIPIKNRRNQSIKISKGKNQKIRKIIIYKCDIQLSDKNSKTKFYHSKEVDIIHIFEISDYYNICNFLITPKELDDYLEFRENFISANPEFIKNCKEQYLLAHFIHTDNPKIIDKKYLIRMEQFDPDIESYDMSKFLNIFHEKIRGDKNQDYHQIITEIAKLRRYELSAFKERFFDTIELAKKNELNLPFRFYCQRTDCAFTFIPLIVEHISNWENALINITEIYKYKRKSTKAIGVICFKKDDFIDLNWTLFKHDWKYDAELEELVKKTDIGYDKGQIKQVPRYKFKPN
ncbi:hypothetical protein [Gillisia sp. CAL575]|uniref:hypothetical protein n=1 Tax=Gillisia sp. CAL575 TaxID=985255 RepID=UPI0003A41E78|nr:hypothetical protein [Gillisia sp. CAL575]